jgi:FixJ family two-component response regulator
LDIGPTIALKTLCVRAFEMVKSRARIAVVDDDASVRNALGRLLRASSFEVRTFGSGVEFLGALASYTPQCIVLDVHMQGMNGLDVQKHLSHDGSTTPVIVMTGHDSQRVEAECRALGARAYLAKPIDEKVLLKAIGRIVGLAGKPH